MDIYSLSEINERLDITDIWDKYKAEITDIKKSLGKLTYSEQLSLAHSFTYIVLKFLWNKVNYKKMFNCRAVFFDKFSLNIRSIKLARNIAKFLYELSIVECGYYIGVTYTLLLPDEFKSTYGVYYTPPTLSERLLDLLAAEGVNWAKDNIMDPACGGGAFLIPVANRILGDHRIKKLTPIERITYLETHLAGIEIDSFAAWITTMLLDIITYPDAVASGRKMKNIITETDTIEYALKETSKFDLIIGNPPYGRISLNDQLREKYSRSLFGHANMYGLFIDAALRLKAPTGLIGYVTPTSFLGGEYFKNLRKLLTELAPPISIDFISARSGVFEDVLQETCLAVYGNNCNSDVLIHGIYLNDEGYSMERVGTFQINLGQSPWFMPRSRSEIKIINALKSVNFSLRDYGYKASTGPLVWNRHKYQLRQEYEEGVYPIIWSEAVNEDEFSIDYKIRKDKKYLKVNNDQEFLICRQPVVLVQRTTSKEQSKRIVTSVMDEGYFRQWKGAVVENHVNAIHPLKDSAKISLKALSLILNTNIVDRIFRCISGSVAVSVSELHALPLPEPEKVKEVDQLIIKYKTGELTITQLKSDIEILITKAYGIEV